MIPGSVTSIGGWAFELCTSLKDITIHDSVKSLGQMAFYACTSLTSITIPNSVTTLGYGAFANCSSLRSVHFQGSAPNPSDDLSVFSDSSDVTVYYLPGISGWASTFDGRPTALWLLPYPLILNNGPGFGVQADGFGFTISWATNIPVVVEACMSLTNPVWNPVATNTLTGGTSYFGDHQWTNYAGRYYRLRSD